MYITVHTTTHPKNISTFQNLTKTLKTTTQLIKNNFAPVITMGTVELQYSELRAAMTGGV